jgi:hypothetical protein
MKQAAQGGPTRMNVWGFAIWFAVLGIIASINAYQYVVRIPLLYWVGTGAFGVGGIVAAHYHRGVDANVWGAVAFAGWLCSSAGLYGFPPRKPSRRVRRSA